MSNQKAVVAVAWTIIALVIISDPVGRMEGLALWIAIGLITESCLK
tara:strand:- start:2167 stop:2304 length:138 start_codon:yes stop_codon:yes gene_type:complete